MKIKSVSAKNLKGQTFDQPLAPVTVIAGPNARGKSSRIEAIQLALAGYLPGIPKTGSGIFAALASGNPLRVEAVDDSGESHAREWREAKGKVVFTGPDDPIMPPVALDADEYFALSAPDRTKFIFARAKVDLSIPKLTATITANIKNIKLDENTPQTEQVIAETVASVEKSAKLAGSQTPQEFIADLYDGTKETLKLANENARRMDQTVQGLTQIKAESTASSDIEKRLATARQHLEDANATTARCLAEWNAAKRSLADAEGKRQLIAGETAAREKLAALEKELETLKLKPTSPVSIKDQAEAHAKAFSAHKVNVDSGYRASESLAALEKQLADVDSIQCCDKCGSDLSARRESLKLELPPKIAEAQRLLLEADEQFNQTAEALHDAETVLEDARRAGEAHAANLRALNDKQTEIAKLTRQLEGSAVAAAEVAKIPALTEAVATTEAAYKTAAADSVNRKATADAYGQEHQKLLAERAEQRQRAVALEEAAKKKAEALVLKEVVALLQSLQEEIVAQSVQPILDAANSLCDGILRLPLAMKDGEIGFMDASGFVGHKTMSDSEKLLTYASLSLALAAEAPFKLCVIGRFESFDDEKKSALIQRALELVESGEIDQCLFVLVGDGSKSFEHKNFSLVQL